MTDDEELPRSSKAPAGRLQRGRALGGRDKVRERAPGIAERA
jgi:hypothetical protein